jgi:hypothetical protein
MVAVSDQQLLVLALSMIIPLSMLLYSNSRITDVKETLRAEIQALRSQFEGQLRAMQIEMNAGFDRISAQIKAHELEHHR